MVVSSPSCAMMGGGRGADTGVGARLVSGMLVLLGTYIDVRLLEGLGAACLRSDMLRYHVGIIVLEVGVDPSPPPMSGITGVLYCPGN